MTPRSFWQILIKILGIYIILESLTVIPQIFSTIYFFTTQTNGHDGNNIYLIEIEYFAIAIIIDGLVLWCSLFKTDWIIDKLKLDKGFQDERFEFNIHRSTTLKIAIMIMGGLFLIDSFPIVFKDLFDCFQKSEIYGSFRSNPQSAYLVMHLLKTFIGLFMLTNSRIIINYIELKRKKTSKNDVTNN